MRVQVGDGGHDLRDPRLVVGAQQRVARCGHDVVAGARGEVRLGRRVERRAVARERDRLAVVVAVHDRHDARARRVGARVEMGDEADDDGPIPAAGSGQRRRDVAVGVDGRVGEADLRELLLEQARELELPAGARGLRAVTRGLRVDAHVAVQAREQVGGDRFGELGGEVRHRGPHRRAPWPNAPSPPRSAQR